MHFTNEQLRALRKASTNPDTDRALQAASFRTMRHRWCKRTGQDHAAFLRAVEHEIKSDAESTRSILAQFEKPMTYATAAGWVWDQTAEADADAAAYGDFHDRAYGDD
jgi:acyl-CoA reductase-like NAD-dependent aldehyde dehydrogenase